MASFFDSLSALIWGPYCLIPLLLGAGFYLTCRLGVIQLRGFFHGINITRGKYDDPNDPGEVSHFKALATALSATIGTGNIVGVASAILAGGPGAVFWMWITALFGMAVKYTSCTLALKHRRLDDQGEAHGGPMYYIEAGLGPKFKWLAVSFAVFTALASFGIGNMFQINNIVSAVSLLVTGANGEPAVGLQFVVGLTIAILVALVILGGIKRIAKLAGVLVPVMCLLYLIAGLAILIKNVALIPQGLKLIFYHAFVAPEAVAGGLLGGVIRSGVSRGLFSNEAGLGSAAIAHGAAKTKEPVREGLVAMLGPFVDTLIICSITALVIVVTGSFSQNIPGGQLTAFAFEQGLKGSGWVVALGTILFAFSTLIAWSYYGDRAVDYLFGKKMIKPYRLCYSGIVFLGAMIKLKMVITISDALNGLMALPNLVAIIVLAPQVAKMSKAYFSSLKEE